ncbi:MAG: hypothetical protein AAB588_04765 [Patescibacteria group bacterium]
MRFSHLLGRRTAAAKAARRVKEGETPSARLERRCGFATLSGGRA